MKYICFKNFAAVIALILLISCSSTRPLMITENAIGKKEGLSTATFVFGIPIDGGDYSLKTAARNGGISKISTVDRKVFNYFLIYKIQTIVTGD